MFIRAKYVTYGTLSKLIDLNRTSTASEGRYVTVGNSHFWTSDMYNHRTTMLTGWFVDERKPNGISTRLAHLILKNGNTKNCIFLQL